RVCVVIENYTSFTWVLQSVARLVTKAVVTSPLQNRQSHRACFLLTATLYKVRNPMKKTRTYLAVMAMAASVSLLAACSNEDDTAAPADTAPPPAASPADPMPSPGASPSTSPTDPMTPPDSGAPTAPPPSSSMSDATESAS